MKVCPSPALLRPAVVVAQARSRFLTVLSVQFGLTRVFQWFEIAKITNVHLSSTQRAVVRYVIGKVRFPPKVIPILSRAL